jgi:hypothetical protein
MITSCIYFRLFKGLLCTQPIKLLSLILMAVFIIASTTAQRTAIELKPGSHNKAMRPGSLSR